MIKKIPFFSLLTRLGKPMFFWVVLWLISFPGISQVQDSSLLAYKPAVTRFLEVGVSANAYRGDLSPRYAQWSSAFQAGLKLNFKKRLNSHFNLAIGTISGQNVHYSFVSPMGQETTPNRFFSSTFLSMNYDLQIHLLKYKGWMVYLSQGFGLIRFSPKDANNQDLLSNYSSRPADETYGHIAVVLPTQAGVNYIFANGYGVGVQAGWLNQQTDYIDNISMWGNRDKQDNTLWTRITFMAPLSFSK